MACALLLCPALSGFGRLQAAAGPYYAPIRRQIDGFALGRVSLEPELVRCLGTSRLEPLGCNFTVIQL